MRFYPAVICDIIKITKKRFKINVSYASEVKIKYHGITIINDLVV